ncbi:hypothetical protein FRC08_005577 [Ceratobasidium sp. 394]|nr:hypothetical protein FRC08_005577 [Ceratobasidium sp. 394]
MDSSAPILTQYATSSFVGPTKPIQPRTPLIHNSQAAVSAIVEKYLGTEPLSPEVFGKSGPLGYWQSLAATSSRPRLAEFATSYLTAPAW